MNFASDIAGGREISGKGVVEYIRPLKSKAEAMYVFADTIPDSLTRERWNSFFSKKIMCCESWHIAPPVCVIPAKNSLPGMKPENRSF